MYDYYYYFYVIFWQRTWQKIWAFIAHFLESSRWWRLFDLFYFLCKVTNVYLGSAAGDQRDFVAMYMHRFNFLEPSLIKCLIKFQKFFPKNFSIYLNWVGRWKVVKRKAGACRNKIVNGACRLKNILKIRML